MSCTNQVEVIVERFSFFRSANGNFLRWTEAFPENHHSDCFECGCTKNAKTKPSGIPSSVHNEIVLKYNDASLPIGTGCLTFGELGGSEHRYFWFNPRQRSVRIEIMLPNHNPIGVFFANLFYGDQIDTTSLMNGHSPTRLDLNGIANKHWLHDCSWGQEGFRILTNQKEITLWDSAYQFNEVVNSRSGHYVSDLTSSVQQIHHSIKNDAELLSGFINLQQVLAPLAENIKPTELFKLAVGLSQEVSNRN